MHQPGGGYELFSHGPVAYEPELVVVLTQVGITCRAGSAVSARHHTLDDHAVAGLEVCRAARLHHNSTPLVTDNDGIANIRGVHTAVDDVEVGPAYPDHDWTDQNIPRGSGRRAPWRQRGGTLCAVAQCLHH